MSGVDLKWTAAFSVVLRQHLVSRVSIASVSSTLSFIFYRDVQVKASDMKLFKAYSLHNAVNDKTMNRKNIREQ